MLCVSWPVRFITPLDAHRGIAKRPMSLAFCRIGISMSLFQWIVLVGALGPFVYYLLATYCSWDYFRQVRRAAPPDASFRPPISILKPVRGFDRDASENFASFCRLDYPEYEIVFAVS